MNRKRRPRQSHKQWVVDNLNSLTFDSEEEQSRYLRKEGIDDLEYDKLLYYRTTVQIYKYQKENKPVPFMLPFLQQLTSHSLDLKRTKKERLVYLLINVVPFFHKITFGVYYRKSLKDSIVLTYQLLTRGSDLILFITCGQLLSFPLLKIPARWYLIAKTKQVINRTLKTGTSKQLKRLGRNLREHVRETPSEFDPDVQTAVTLLQHHPEDIILSRIGFQRPIRTK